MGGDIRRDGKEENKLQLILKYNSCTHHWNYCWEFASLYKMTECCENHALENTATFIIDIIDDFVETKHL